jgi:nucleoid DNA-binding protein
MSNNLTKRDIVLDIYEKTDFAQKEVRESVQLTLDAIATALSEGRNVELRNFGVCVNLALVATRTSLKQTSSYRRVR